MAAELSIDDKRDAESVRHLGRLEGLADDPPAFPCPGSRCIRQRSRLDGTGGPSVLAYEDDKPVGMGAGWLYKPGFLMVVAMWTEPASRRKGVGLGILVKVLDWSCKHGLQPELWVADSKPVARRLYERYGFRPTGETAPLREDTTLTMSRFLLPTFQ
jgi:GNAT superfamily N-acetyltransferase